MAFGQYPIPHWRKGRDQPEFSLGGAGWAPYDALHGHELWDEAVRHPDRVPPDVVLDALEAAGGTTVPLSEFAEHGPLLDRYDKLTRRVVALCEARGWGLDWRARGCYLHLESSELIEAMRGKGDSGVEEEAGDVLFVLLSILGVSGGRFTDAVSTLESKMDALEG